MMMPRHVFFFFITSLWILPYSVVWAQDWNDLVMDKAQTLIHDPSISVHIENPTALSSLACSTPLEIQTHSRGPAKMTFQVRCMSPEWQRFVSLRLEQWKPALITTRALRRSERLQAADLRSEEVNVLQLTHGIISDISELAGLETSRAIPAGQIIKPSYFSKAFVIQKGQQVSLSVLRHHILVQSKGTALQKGSIGDRIAAKNNSTGRVVEGTIHEDGNVYID